VEQIKVSPTLIGRVDYRRWQPGTLALASGSMTSLMLTTGAQCGQENEKQDDCMQNSVSHFDVILWLLF